MWAHAYKLEILAWEFREEDAEREVRRARLSDGTRKKRVRIPKPSLRNFNNEVFRLMDELQSPRCPKCSSARPSGAALSRCPTCDVAWLRLSTAQAAELAAKAIDSALNLDRLNDPELRALGFEHGASKAPVDRLANRLRAYWSKGWSPRR